MNQRSLIYSFVARGTAILAEYTVFKGNFKSITSQCLQKLPASTNRFTFTSDGHSFNFLIDGGFSYCVVAVESVGRKVTFAFLDRVREEFIQKYSGGKASTATENSLNKEFGPKLKEQMQYCVDHAEDLDKLDKLNAQVSEVTGIMRKNIDAILDRGGKLEILVDKTEYLRDQAQGYRQTATAVKRKEWLKNMKIKLIVLAVIVALILIIVLSVCGGTC